MLLLPNYGYEFVSLFHKLMMLNMNPMSLLSSNLHSLYHNFEYYSLLFYLQVLNLGNNLLNMNSLLFLFRHHMIYYNYRKILTPMYHKLGLNKNGLLQVLYRKGSLNLYPL